MASVAYYRMDYHAISYVQHTQKLYGHCYFNQNEVVKEELNGDYIMKVEKYHPAYITAKRKHGKKIPINIGKGNTEMRNIQDTPNNSMIDHNGINPWIKYRQGKQNTCYVAALKSAIDYHKRLLFHKEKDDKVKEPFDELLKSLGEDNITHYKRSFFDNVKKIMDNHDFETVLESEKKRLSKQISVVSRHT